MKTLVAVVAFTIVGVSPSGGPSADTLAGGSAVLFGGCYDMWACWVGMDAGDQLAQGPVGSHKSEPTYWHSDCRACTGSCHSLCSPDEEEAVQQAYVDVMRGIEEGDVDMIIGTLTLLGDYVVWNEDRSSIQVLSCGRDYVAASFLLDGYWAQEAIAALDQD